LLQNKPTNTHTWLELQRGFNIHKAPHVSGLTCSSSGIELLHKQSFNIYIVPSMQQKVCNFFKL